jgi:hypothetical protein
MAASATGLSNPYSSVDRSRRLPIVAAIAAPVWSLPPISPRARSIRNRGSSSMADAAAIVSRRVDHNPMRLRPAFDRTSVLSKISPVVFPTLFQIAQTLHRNSSSLDGPIARDRVSAKRKIHNPLPVTAPGRKGIILQYRIRSVTRQVYCPQLLVWLA